MVFPCAITVMGNIYEIDGFSLIKICGWPDQDQSAGDVSNMDIATRHHSMGIPGC